MASFSWNGSAFIKKVHLASRLGINKTMGECVALAKRSHPWKNRTGTAERSITIAATARTNSSGVTTGLWGSKSVSYFAGLEFGNRPHVITARRSRLLTFKIDGKWISKKSVNHPGNKPMPVLAPTALKVYPRLALHISSAWRSLP